jgi:hypothetical protein
MPLTHRRWQGKGSASPVELACRLVTTIAERLPARAIHVVADAAYHGEQVRTLPEQVSWTTRLPRNATRYGRAPARTGRRGRPRLKGTKLGRPAQVAADLVWQAISVAPLRSGRHRAGRGGRLPVVRRVRPRPRCACSAYATATTRKPSCSPWSPPT